jgi:hypothetical protein
MKRSQFNLFYDIGVYLFGCRSREALDFAVHVMAEPDANPPAQLDPQLILDLEAVISRTKKNRFS